jgi:hypothetical protein
LFAQTTLAYAEDGIGTGGTDGWASCRGAVWTRTRLPSSTGGLYLGLSSMYAHRGGVSAAVAVVASVAHIMTDASRASVIFIFALSG